MYSGYPPRDYWASAGLLFTVRDMAKYDLAVDRHELPKAETLARAWTPFLSNAGQPLAQGLGWYVTDYWGTRLVWRYGHWGTGFSPIITNDIFACDFTNVFVPEVANGTGAEDASRKTQAAPASPDEIPTTGPARDCERSSGTALAKWIVDCRAKARKAIPLDPTLAAAYAGRYQLPHRVITVTEEDGRLYLDIPQGDRSELFSETPAQFFLKIRPWTLTFVKEGSQVIRLDILDTGEIVSGRRVD